MSKTAKTIFESLSSNSTDSGYPGEWETPSVEAQYITPGTRIYAVLVELARYNLHERQAATATTLAEEITNPPRKSLQTATGMSAALSELFSKKGMAQRREYRAQGRYEYRVNKRGCDILQNQQDFPQ